MPDNTFAPLFEHYRSVIEQMPDTFTSHQFILALANQYQDLYVDALASYRTTSKREAPFQAAHGVLSRHLHTMNDLVRYEGKVMSENIFRHTSQCAQWRKIEATIAS